MGRTKPAERRYMPLPHLLTDPFAPVRKSDSYMSLTVNGKRVSGEDESDFMQELDERQVMFYVGKMVPLTFRERMARFLREGSIEDPTYSDAVIRGILDFCGTWGFQPQIMVCRSMSEIFNGPESMEGALSIDETRERICRIAGNRWGESSYPLQVHNVEEDSFHQALFETLRGSIDSTTGMLDVEFALGRGGFRSDSGHSHFSLQLAQVLYQVAREDDPLHPSHYYALVEVAIRLSDVIRGQIVHGGIDRQSKYDDIIGGLLRGEKGRFKNLKGLSPLFPMLEKYDFATLHLVSGRNYFSRRAHRNRAATRLSIAVAIGLTAGVGLWRAGYEQGHEDAHAQREALDDYLARELEGVTFYWDSKFPLDKDKNVSFFRDTLVPSMLVDLAIRYCLSEGQLESLQLEQLMTQHLLQNKGALRNVPDDTLARIPLLDSFMIDNQAYFLAQGVDVGRPYQHFAQYRKAFDATEALDHDILVRSNDILLWQYIGEFKSTQSYDGYPQDLYVVYVGGRQYLMARDVAKESYVGPEDAPGPMVFSTAKGKEKVVAFRMSMELYDAARIADSRTNFPYYQLKKEEKDIVVPEADVWFMERLSDYVDYYDGEFYYEMGIHRYWDSEKQVDRQILVARDMKRGDKVFSTRVAEEAYVYFCKTQGCYSTTR
jgi:hypothetical protein